MLERSAVPVVASKTLATLAVVNTGASYAAAPVLAPGPLPFSITVTDPDRAGAASVSVTMSTTAPFASDSVVLTLPAIAPGQFRVTSVIFSKATSGCTSTNVPVNPASLEICGGGTATVTFNDTTTPSGSPQGVTQTVGIP